MGNLISAPTYAHSVSDFVFGDKEVDASLTAYQQRVEAARAAKQAKQAAAEQREQSEGSIISEPSQVLPYLFVGDRASVRDPAQLRRLRIGHILQLNPVATTGPVNETVQALNCQYTRLPVDDVDTYNIIMDFPKSNAIIEAARADNTLGKPAPNVLVYCEEGVSRCTTIVMAFLLSRGWTLQGAIALMKQTHPATFPNSGFFKQLLEEEQRLLNKTSLTEADYPKIFED